MLSSPQASLTTLDQVHFNAVNQALSNVFATDIAFETFAQIVDGVPLYLTAHKSSSNLYPRHPIRNHTTLCPGVSEKVRDIQRDFDIKVLQFNVEVCVCILMS